MSFHDVLDLVRALAWPLVALAALVVLRHALPEIARDFARRATKIAVFEFAVELAPAAAPPGDARPPAVALLGAPVLGPSLLPALVAELEKTAPADYLVVDLLGERGWLTSRLFLWAELLGRTRSLRC